MRPGMILAAIIAVAMACLVLFGTMAVNTGLVDTVIDMAAGFSLSPPASDVSEGDPVEEPGAEEETPREEPADVDIVFARPQVMRGAWLNPGEDYLKGDAMSGESAKAEIDAIFAQLSEWEFNTVFVPFSMRGRPLYSSALSDDELVIENSDGTVFEPLAYILKSARDRGIYTYGVLDLGMHGSGGLDPCKADDFTRMSALAAECAALYGYDGFLIGGYGYADGNRADYSAYMSSNPGADFDVFMRERMNTVIASVVSAVKNAGSNLYVGLLADPVWAVGGEGLSAGAGYSSLTDGRADTRGWVLSGLFDFVMVDNDLSTSNPSLNFGDILEWWNGVCSSAGTAMYISHASDKAGSADRGWKSPDQLTHQVIACQEESGCSGSAFRSMKALLDNPGNSTTLLIGKFRDTINIDHIDNTLNITNPSKTSITTYESKFNIRGSADSNLPLVMNGKAVEVSESGFFSIDLTLAAGTNTYKFEHKGETVTYTITRKVAVLRDITPSSGIETDGNNMISITAIAYSGAQVTAKLNGKSITLKKSEYPSGDDGASTIVSDYDYYIGQYTVPAGIEGKSRDLGKVVVYGSYKGSHESKTGGRIVVKAIPVKPKEDTPAKGTPGKVNPVDPNAGGGKALASGKLVVVSADYGETTNGGTSTEPTSRAKNAYLPQGTVDYVVKEVVGGKFKYYLLGCGRRIEQQDVAVYKEHGTLKSNTAKVYETNILSNGDTRIILDMNWNVPYNFELKPQNYGAGGEISSFTATYVDLTFSYTTHTIGLPDTAYSSVFSKAEWINGSGNTKILRLHLRAKAGFAGYSSVWEKDGRLVMTFRKSNGLASGSKPLSGKRIVIDPGHGGAQPGAVNGSYKEKEWTLIYSNRLKEKLEALGATVVMTRTTDRLVDAELTPASLKARNKYARNNFTDLFISIHVNAAEASSARGSSVFFFNEYSLALAKAVGESAKAAYNKNVPGAYNRAVSYSHARFTVMRVHDCPSILVETGFLTNTKELELMRTDAFNNWFNQALVDGILQYFRTRPSPQAPAAPPSTTQPSADTTTTASAEAAGTITTASTLFAVKRRRRRRRRFAI